MSRGEVGPIADFGRMVRQRRVRLGISPQEVFHYTGLQVNYLARLEKGMDVQMTMTMMFKVLEYLSLEIVPTNRVLILKPGEDPQ